MEIYVVQQGDSIQSIANIYGISVERLISDNGLINPYSLVVGQTIVILYPKEIYTVKEGDTLTTIADDTGITVMQLYRNNPFLYNRKFIYPNEDLVISYNTVKNLQVNAYTYAFLNKDTLIRALPYLTFISIFNYRVTDNGNITNYSDDTEIIKLAKENDTIPLMMISSFSPTGEVDIELVYQLLLDNKQQVRLINEILQILRSKGFKGINFLTNYITEYNQGLYLNFFKKISVALRQEEYIFMITFNPDYTSTTENLDYQSLSFLVDRMIFLQNIWEKNNQPPSPVSDISLIRPFIDNITSEISSELISLGKPLIGLDWELPFIPNVSTAKLMSLNSTITLASELNVEIKFDEISQTPYYEYTRSYAGAPENHIVWFTDARSIDALDEVVLEYDLVGTGLWQLTSYNQQLYSMINALFNIIKFPNKQ